MSDPKRNHYIPEFYLKQWVNPADGKIEVFKNVPQKGIISDRHTPKHSGFEFHLYKNMEEKYFKLLDDKAAKVLAKLKKLGSSLGFSSTPQKAELDTNDKKFWGTFLLAFSLRTPEIVEEIKKKYKSGLKEFQEAKGYTIFSESELELLGLHQIPQILSNKVIEDLMNLKWMYASLEKSNKPLLTSDNPLIFEPKLAHPNCTLILPLSPKTAFIAAKMETIASLHEMNKTATKFAAHINQATVAQARKYVYAYSKNDVEKCFLQNHLRYFAS